MPVVGMVAADLAGSLNATPTARMAAPAVWLPGGAVMAPSVNASAVALIALPRLFVWHGEIKHIFSPKNSRH